MRCQVEDMAVVRRHERENNRSVPKRGEQKEQGCRCPRTVFTSQCDCCDQKNATDEKGKGVNARLTIADDGADKGKITQVMVTGGGKKKDAK